MTIYAEWVLGENRERTGPHIVTRREPTTGALLASNAFRDAFADRVAFLDLFGGERRTLTGDRTEFIGRNGSLARPGGARSRRAVEPDGRRRSIRAARCRSASRSSRVRSRP